MFIDPKNYLLKTQTIRSIRGVLDQVLCTDNGWVAGALTFKLSK